MLRDELRLLEISVWLENLDDLKAAARKLESDFQAAQAERDGARAALDALYAESEAYGDRMREKDMEIESVRAEASELDGRAKEKESALAVLESTVTHHQENIDRAEAELADQASRSGGLVRQAEEQEDQVRALEAQIAELNEALDALLEKAQEAAAQAGGAQSQAEALRGREAVAIAAAADARAEEAAAVAESEQLRQRLETVEQDRTAAQETLAQRMEERKKKAAAASEQRMQLTMDAGALENRIRLLREMEKDYEGFSKAVKLVCQAKGALRGIHGPVANLMKTDGKYSLAIEIALGAGLQNIVVDREEDAKAAIGYLKQRAPDGHPGRPPAPAGRGERVRLCGRGRGPCDL